MKKLDSVKKRKPFINKVILLFLCFSFLFYLIIASLVVGSYFVNGRGDVANDLVLPLLHYFLIAMPIEGLLVFTLCCFLTIYKLVVKKNVLVRNINSLYELSRTNCLIIDEIDALFTDNCSIKEIVRLGKEKESDIVDIAGSIASKANGENQLIHALQKLSYIPLYLDEGVVCDKDNYYTDYNGSRYVLGKANSFKYRAEEYVKTKIEPYLTKGYEILLVGRFEKDKKNGKYTEIADVFGAIVAKNEINDELKNMINSIQNRGVMVKVLSSKNPVAVSEQSKLAGIKNAEKCLSISDDLHDKNLDEYVVFGDLTDKEKKVLVSMLKKEGKVVACLGEKTCIDGSDSSLSFNSESEADIIIEKEKRVDDVYDECKLLSKKLQKIFVVLFYKTVFVYLYLLGLSICSLFGISFDYRPIGLGVIITILILVGFIFDNNSNTTIKKTTDKLLLLSALSLGAIGSTFLLFFLQRNGISYTGINDLNTCLSMCGVVFALSLPIVLLSMYLPFNQRGIIVFFGLTTFILALLGGLWGVSIYYNREIFGIYFNLLNGQTILIIAIITILFVSVYYIISYLIDNYDEKEEQQ